MAMIPGLPAPSRYNPLVQPTRSTERRNWILERMLQARLHRPATLPGRRRGPISASYRADPELNAPSSPRWPRAEMVGRYSSEAYTEATKVITTVRSDLQNAASQSVRDGLIDYDQRHGYRGGDPPAGPDPRRLAQAPGPAAQRRRPGAGDRHQVEKSGIMVMTRDGRKKP